MAKRKPFKWKSDDKLRAERAVMLAEKGRTDLPAREHANSAPRAIRGERARRDAVARQLAAERERERLRKVEAGEIDDFAPNGRDRYRDEWVAARALTTRLLRAQAKVDYVDIDNISDVATGPQISQSVDVPEWLKQKRSRDGFNSRADRNRARQGARTVIPAYVSNAASMTGAELEDLNRAWKAREDLSDGCADVYWRGSAELGRMYYASCRGQHRCRVAEALLADLSDAQADYVDVLKRVADRLNLRVSFAGAGWQKLASQFERHQHLNGEIARREAVRKSRVAGCFRQLKDVR